MALTPHSTFTSMTTIAIVSSAIAELLTPIGVIRAGDEKSVSAQQNSTAEAGRASSVDEGSLDAITALSAATPRAAANRWESGEIRFAGQWATPDHVAQLVAGDRIQISYRERRSKCPETADGHLKLAQWCREQGLADQQRAHLLVAAQLAPTDPRPRKALGLVEYKSAWMTPAELSVAKSREVDAIKAYNTWKARLSKLNQDLESDDQVARQNAVSQLRAIRDPQSIPAMEEVLSQSSESLGTMVVETVSQILHQAATRSLVRHAVWHTSPRVRDAAVDELLHREPTHYVGNLIHLLRPTTSGETWTTLPNGATAGVWFTQDFERNNVVVSTVDFTGVARWNTLTPERRRTRNQRLANLIDGQNQFRLENAHSALRRVSGEDFGTDQQAWVNWWSNVSYVSPGEYSSPSRTTVARYENIGAIDTGHSCFVAGTPMWTLRGLVSIDQIQLGDLVLAKNVESGALEYQPVIDRTIRRQKPTLKLQFDGEVLGVTPGHPIWSADKKWMRAREFRSGDHVGVCGGSVELVSTSEGQADFVYNLVVAGSNTYFVGRNKILVHDITPIADAMLAEMPSADANE